MYCFTCCIISSWHQIKHMHYQCRFNGRFPYVRCTSCHPINSVKSLKKLQTLIITGVKYPLAATRLNSWGMQQCSLMPVSSLSHEIASNLTQLSMFPGEVNQRMLFQWKASEPTSAEYACSTLCHDITCYCNWLLQFLSTYDSAGSLSIEQTAHFLVQTHYSCLATYGYTTDLLHADCRMPFLIVNWCRQYIEWQHLSFIHVHTCSS